MRVVRFCGLVVCDAENIVAETWKILEAYDVETPKLAIAPCMSGEMHLALTFASHGDSALIVSQLARFLAQYGFVHAGAHKTGRAAIAGARRRAALLN
jgi:hypothetical protein